MPLHLQLPVAFAAKRVQPIPIGVVGRIIPELGVERSGAVGGVVSLDRDDGFPVGIRGDDGGGRRQQRHGHLATERLALRH